METNDVHSQLNATVHSRIADVRHLWHAQRTIAHLARGEHVIASGGRHAMGGQQFRQGGVLLDTRNFSKILDFDRKSGLVQVQSGIQWPALIEGLHRLQSQRIDWGINQKPTGTDDISIGGALSANIHGRGLLMKPFVQDIESFQLIVPSGDLLNVSRTENAELFKLAIGGYGLFGFVASVTLRLSRRVQVQRRVELLKSDGLIDRLNEKIDSGAVYGDFQFSIDPDSEDFLRKGILSTYTPIPEDRTNGTAAASMQPQRKLSLDQWQELLYLAHNEPGEAFEKYCQHYIATDGQIYFSDLHQLSTYLPGYHEAMLACGRERGSYHGAGVTAGPRHGVHMKASEIITEIYVPRERLSDFLLEAADDFRRNRVKVIYGTIRLIERDDETFLPWARNRFACVIFNLHTEHSHEGIEHSKLAFRRLIDMAISCSGSYYLTYHRYARADQLLSCYPQFPQFLHKKKECDPLDKFSSNWYEHHLKLLSISNAA